MSTLSTLYPTLLDFAKRQGPDGKIQSDIVEILDIENEMLDDIVWKEGNLPTGELTTIRTGIPEPSFRKLYGFVQPAKSETAQVTETCGMLENYSVIDAALANINGNSAAWRMSEERPFIQGFNNKLNRYMFLGNETTEPEGFTGLAPRYNAKSGAVNGDNVLLDASGGPDGSDNASIYLVVWSPETVFGLFPKGSKMGLSMRDLGEVTDTDGSGGLRQVLRTHYRWDAGLCVKDWRYVVRIQIDQENLTKGAATGPDLIDLFSQAIELIPNINAGRPAFYCNRTVRGFIRRQIMNKTSYQLTVESLTRANGALIKVPMFDGIPIRRCDALLNTETGIS